MSRANPRFRRANPALPVTATPIYLVQAIGHSEAGIWYMDFAYQAAGAVIPGTAESGIASTWLAAAGTQLRACFTAQCFLDSCKVSSVTTPSRIPFTNTTAANLGAGTAGGQALPSEVAAILSKYTTTRGQHGRGRNYFPNVPTSFVTPAVDPDRLNAAGLAAYNAFITAFTANTINDGTNAMQLAIYTRTTRGTPVTLGAGVSTIVMRQLLGTVRRRRIGRGK